MSKTALLLGSEGFVGRNTLPGLLARGYDVTEVDIKAGVDARHYLPRSGKVYDLIIHAAAIVGGRETIDNAPIKVAYDFGLDSDVIQFCARTHPGRVVLISSSAAYPTSLQFKGSFNKLREELIVPGKIQEPDEVYGLSKLVLERQAELLRKLGVGVTVIRPFSGYGADQDDCYPFPKFLQRALNREDPFEIWGDGTQVRDFLHISDFTEQMFTLAENKVDGPVNLATGVPTSFNELARQMCEAVGYSPDFKHLTSKPTGVFHRVGDPTLINKILPAKVSLAEGIRMSLS